MHNRLDLTMRCIASLNNQEFRNFTIVLCDDGSTDGTADYISTKHPGVVVLRGDGDLWWAGATNKCIEYVLSVASEDDYLLTLNNDLEVANDYLRNMYQSALAEPAAIITSACYDIKNREHLVDAGWRINWLTTRSTRASCDQNGQGVLAEITHAPGRGTLIPVKIFKEIGVYDSDGLPHYGADYDFTFRARRSGYRVLVNYNAKLYSHTEKTGLTLYKGRKSISGLVDYLTNIKSPACLKYRWRLAANNCPKWLLPSFIVIDTCFVVGSYLKN